MIKKNILFILIMVTAFILPGCGGRKEEESKKIVIKFTVAEKPEQCRLFQKVVSVFEKEHPGIKVRLNNDGSDCYTKMLTQMAGGSGADVIQIHYIWFPDFVTRDVLFDLGPFIEKDNYDLNDFFTIGVESYKYEEKHYAIPFVGSARVFLYNKDLFDEAGLPYPDDANWTWEDFVEIARKLTRDIDGDGKIDQFGASLHAFGDTLLSWIWSNGGDVFNEEVTECTFNTPKALEVVKIYNDLVHKYHALPVGISGARMADMGDLFALGKVGLVSSGPWMCTIYQDIKNLQWDVALYPKGRNGRVTRYAGRSYAIWSESKHPEEAWKLIKFLVGPVGGRILSEGGEDVPARKSLAYSDAFLRPDVPWNARKFVDSIKDSRRYQLSSRVFEIESVIGRNFEKLGLGLQTPEEFVEEITKDVNALLKAK